MVVCFYKLAVLPPRLPAVDGPHTSLVSFFFPLTHTLNRIATLTHKVSSVPETKCYAAYRCWVLAVITWILRISLLRIRYWLNNKYSEKEFDKVCILNIIRRWLWLPSTLMKNSDQLFENSNSKWSLFKTDTFWVSYKMYFIFFRPRLHLLQTALNRLGREVPVWRSNSLKGHHLHPASTRLIKWVLLLNYCF